LIIISLKFIINSHNTSREHSYFEKKVMKMKKYMQSIVFLIYCFYIYQTIPIVTVIFLITIFILCQNNNLMVL